MLAGLISGALLLAACSGGGGGGSATPGPSGSPPDGTGRFSIAVTKVTGGAGSSFLHGLPEGAQLRAIGPQGFFTRPRGAKHPSLFVGTGTGVTPSHAYAAVGTYMVTLTVRDHALQAHQASTPPPATAKRSATANSGVVCASW